MNKVIVFLGMIAIALIIASSVIFNTATKTNDWDKRKISNQTGLVLLGIALLVLGVLGVYFRVNFL